MFFIFEFCCSKINLEDLVHGEICLEIYYEAKLYYFSCIAQKLEFDRLRWLAGAEMKEIKDLYNTGNDSISIYMGTIQPYLI